MDDNYSAMIKFFGSVAFRLTFKLLQVVQELTFSYGKWFFDNFLLHMLCIDLITLNSRHLINLQIYEVILLKLL